jgi:hypothetical protein
MAYLTSRDFGLRAFGEIYGYAFATYVLAGALGPWEAATQPRGLHEGFFLYQYLYIYLVSV